MALEKLIIMRHAKSDWDTGAFDFDRPLADRGLRDAPRMAQWLVDHHYSPDWITSSPARRAKETALMLCDQFNFNHTMIKWQPQIYEASVNNLIQALNKHPATAKTIMVIGHNPGLEELLIYLENDIDRYHTGQKLLPTAGLAILEIPHHKLEKSCARLVQLISPKKLPL